MYVCVRDGVCEMVCVFDVCVMVCVCVYNGVYV